MVVGKAVRGGSVGSGVMTSSSLGDDVGSEETRTLLCEVVGCSVTGALFGELDGCSVRALFGELDGCSVTSLSVGLFDGCYTMSLIC